MFLKSSGICFGRKALEQGVQKTSSKQVETASQLLEAEPRYLHAFAETVERRPIQRFAGVPE